MSGRILRRMKAVQDAEQIADFIARNNLEAAVQFLENAESTLQQLVESPKLGSPFLSRDPNLANLRTCRIKGSPNYMIFYIEHPHAIEVVRILHGARDLDAELRNT